MVCAHVIRVNADGRCHVDAARLPDVVTPRRAGTNHGGLSMQTRRVSPPRCRGAGCRDPRRTRGCPPRVRHPPRRRGPGGRGAGARLRRTRCEEVDVRAGRALAAGERAEEYQRAEAGAEERAPCVGGRDERRAERLRQGRRKARDRRRGGTHARILPALVTANPAGVGATRGPAPAKGVADRQVAEEASLTPPTRSRRVRPGTPRAGRASPPTASTRRGRRPPDGPTRRGSGPCSRASAPHPRGPSP